MPSLNYTGAICTTAQVKARLGITDTSWDTIIDEIILSVAAQIERAAGRQLRRTTTAVTEKHTGGGRRLAMQHYPIVSGDITSVRESAVRDWTTSGSYTSLTLGTDYVFESGENDGQSGIFIRLNQDWMGDEDNPGQVQIIYKGGYSPAGTGSTWDMPADLVGAAIIQSIHELDMRKDPGVVSKSMRGIGIASGTMAERKEIHLLPAVEEVARSYRRLYRMPQ